MEFVDLVLTEAIHRGGRAGEGTPPALGVDFEAEIYTRQRVRAAGPGPTSSNPRLGLVDETSLGARGWTAGPRAHRPQHRDGLHRSTSAILERTGIKQAINAPQSAPDGAADGAEVDYGTSGPPGPSWPASARWQTSALSPLPNG